MNARHDARDIAATSVSATRARLQENKCDPDDGLIGAALYVPRRREPRYLPALPIASTARLAAGRPTSHKGSAPNNVCATAIGGHASVSTRPQASQTHSAHDAEKRASPWRSEVSTAG